MKSSSTSVRLFRGAFLENLTHVPVWLPFAVWAPVVAYFAWRALSSDTLSFSQILFTVLGGLMTWTLSEYFLHRVVFHAKPESALLKRVVFLMHGVHHDYPNDATRLLMPPLAAIPIATTFFILFHLFFSGAILSLFFASFLVGYLIYDYIHYATHHWRVKVPGFSQLKKHHMNHHFVDPEAYFGVSSPLWDWISSKF